MKWILLVFLLIGCTDNQDEEMRQYISSLQTNENASYTVNVILLTGQSNAVGFSKNTDALASELDATPNVQIWQKSADFENLNIGLDNNYARAGLGEHGLELGLSLYVNNPPVYLIKWGVGSTGIAEHLTGGAVYEEFYNNFVLPGLARINALHPTAIINVSLVYWQGEEDSKTAGGVSAYSARFDTWVSLWKTNLGATIPIRICQINGYDSKDDQINAIFAAKALTETYLEVINTQGLLMDDFQHFSYEAKKTISQSILTSLAL